MTAVPCLVVTTIPESWLPSAVELIVPTFAAGAQSMPWQHLYQSWARAVWPNEPMIAASTAKVSERVCWIDCRWDTAGCDLCSALAVRPLRYCVRLEVNLPEQTDVAWYIER